MVPSLFSPVLELAEECQLPEPKVTSSKRNIFSVITGLTYDKHSLLSNLNNQVPQSLQVHWCVK